MCVLMALPLLRANPQTVAGDGWQQRSAFLSAAVLAVQRVLRASRTPHFAALEGVPSQQQLRTWAVRAVGPRCFEHMMSTGARCV